MNLEVMIRFIYLVIDSMCLAIEIRKKHTSMSWTAQSRGSSTFA